MRKATRKEEINIIKHCMLCTNNQVKLRTLVLQTLNRRRLVSARIRKFAKARHPGVWEWRAFLITLKLGWRRYLYGCGHKDSIFVRIQVHQLKSTGGCVCCLYWRAICTGFLIASIISFLISSGKYLS